MDAPFGFHYGYNGQGFDGSIDVKGLVFSVSFSFPGLPSFDFGYDILKGTFL